VTTRPTLDRLGRRRRSSPLRIVARALIVAASLIVVVLVLAAPGAFRMRDRLTGGAESMRAARAAFVRGDTAAALRQLGAARDRFDEATSQASSLVFDVAGVIPGVGSNLDAAAALAAAGAETARAGVEVAAAVESLPGGLDALAPSAGRVPLAPLPVLGNAVGRASTLVDRARRRLAAVGSSSMLLSPVWDAIWDSSTSLEDLGSALSAGRTVFARLPAFFGAEVTKTYLFGAENPAELRGTGGLIGAYSLLTAKNGRLTFSAFHPVQSLPILRARDLPAPNADYRRLYDPQRDGKGFWLNVNMTPDFPSAAIALQTAFEAATGRNVDGVVTADPFALQALLRATGPAPVPGLGIQVTANSVVPLLANTAYATITDPAERKMVLGAVAAAVVTRFLDRGVTASSLRGVVEAAAEAHVKVFSEDRELSSALARTGVGGAFAPPISDVGDFLSVVVNNGAANKVDYYVDRHVRYDVRLDSDGAATASAEIRLANGAPSGGLPKYVLGPNAHATERPGQDVSIVNLYCADCRLTQATRNGRSFDPGIGRELSSTFFQDYATIDPGESVTDRFEYAVPRAWVGDAAGGTYSLRFLGQPTIRPTDLEIRIRVPPGMHVTDATDGVRVEGSVATWSGTPSRTLTIDLAFAPPLPQRLWHELIG
jgi:hypothetical protein